MILDKQREQIFTNSINKDIQDLYDFISSNKIDYLSLDNFIQNDILNKKGFQVYRTLLYDQIFETDRKESVLYGSEIHKQLNDNGFIKIENFFDDITFGKIKNHFYDTKRKFINSNGSFNYPIKFNVLSKEHLQQIVKLCQADQKQSLDEFYMRQVQHCDPKTSNEDSRQYRFHYDKFFPNYKIWFYVENMTYELGPTACFVGSHIPSVSKMRWFYEESVQQNYEWSRASLDVKNYLKEVRDKTGFDTEHILTGEPNTFFIIDTRLLHRRTPAPPGTKRTSLRAILPRLRK